MMNNGIHIVQASASHASALASMGAETFTEAFAEHNNPTDFKKYLDDSFNISQIEKELTEKGSTFFLAYINNELAGYARLRESGEGLEKFPTKHVIELQRIYSYKAFIGKGIGKALLTHCIETAKKKGYSLLWLGVWEHNHHAIQFYKHFGFTEFDSHVFMLGSEAQTDILMKKQLTA
jgi:GNAT superfamily N-acetyltransferase